MHALQFYNRHITLESRVQQTGWHRNCIRKCKTLTTQFTFASISNHVNKPFHISLICFSLWLTLTHTHTLCHHYSFVHCRTNAFCFAKETPQNLISSKIKAQKSKRHAQINRRQVMMMVLMMTIFILRMQIKIINNYTKIEMNSLSRIYVRLTLWYVCVCETKWERDTARETWKNANAIVRFYSRNYGIFFTSILYFEYLWPVSPSSSSLSPLLLSSSTMLLLLLFLLP